MVSTYFQGSQVRQVLILLHLESFGRWGAEMNVIAYMYLVYFMEKDVLLEQRHLLSLTHLHCPPKHLACISETNHLMHSTYNQQNKLHKFNQEMLCFTSNTT